MRWYVHVALDGIGQARIWSRQRDAVCSTLAGRHMRVLAGDNGDRMAGAARSRHSCKCQDNVFFLTHNQKYRGSQLTDPGFELFCINLNGPKFELGLILCNFVVF